MGGACSARELGPTPEARAGAARRVVLVLDGDGRVVRGSRHAARLLERRVGQIVGWPVQALIPRLPLQPGTPGFNLALAVYWHRGGSLALWGLTAAGTRREIEVRMKRLAGGRIALVLRPVGEAGGPAAPGSDDLARFVALAASRPEGVVVTDRRGTITHVNRAAARLLGRAAPQACGVALRDLVAPAPVGEGGLTSRFAWACTGADGGVHIVEPAMRPFVDPLGTVTHHVYMLRDVTDSVRAGQRLAHLAHHDSLTGLPNRALLADRLEQAQARLARHGTGYALLVLDVDGFKAVNDRYGHDVGDQVLVQIAGRLARCLREEDTVARLGGDEFAVILSGSSAPAAVAAAVETLLASLRTPLPLPDGGTLVPSVSIGAARCPGDALEPTELLPLADEAMYRAKREGGQRARHAGEGRAGAPLPSELAPNAPGERHCASGKAPGSREAHRAAPPQGSPAFDGGCGAGWGR